MRLTAPLYALYKHRLRRQLAGTELPRHIGLIMDGNRRWAREQGMANPSLGHQYGAEHAERVLSWCESLGIRYATVFLCSTENLHNRADAEVAFLMDVVERLAKDRLSRPDARWQVHVAGAVDLLPAATARALKHAVEATGNCPTGAHVTLAIGYGGRQEIVDGIRDLLVEHAAAGSTLTEVADTLTIGDIAAHLYTPEQPEPT